MYVHAVEQYIEECAEEEGGGDVCTCSRAVHRGVCGRGRRWRCLHTEREFYQPRRSFSENDTWRVPASGQ